MSDKRSNRRFLAGVLVGLTLGSATTGLAHYKSEPVKYERKHEEWVGKVCARPHHFDHNHGLTVMPEACEG